jgi:hypothetical protein
VGDAGRIAVIDTERGSASKYSDEFDFDVVELDTFAPATFVEMIREAERAGYDLLIIDSLSHAWMGTDGMLDQVDKIVKRKQLSNSFQAWKDANPQERELWDTMLGSKLHLFATLRTKTEYVVEEQTGRDGKKRIVPRKIGTAPIQREGLEYEFDVVADIDMDHNMVISKTRCKALTDKAFNRAGQEVAEILHEWLGEEDKPAPRADTKKAASKRDEKREEKAQPARAKAQAEPEQQEQLIDEAPADGDRVRFRNELIGAMKEHIKALKLPAAVGTHILNVRGYAKSTDMPDEELARFVDQLGQILAYREQDVLSRDEMMERLQQLPDDGSDVLDNLLQDCAAAATGEGDAVAEHAEEQQDLLVK